MLVVIAGPSGSGKSTLAENLRKSAPSFEPLVSYTTRPKRTSDKPGEFRFVDDRLFNRLIAEKQFLWHVQPYGSTYRYGTLADDVNDALGGYDRVAVLIGEALPMLYGYACGNDALDEVLFLYLELNDEKELRRRLAVDATRTDVAERIQAATAQNTQAHQSIVPYRFIDARLPPQEILAHVDSHLTSVS